MNSVRLIYRFPKILEEFESFPYSFTILDSENFNTLIYNPHAVNIHYFLSRSDDENFSYHLSKHPSPYAIRLMKMNPQNINLDGLILNTNPNIAPLLEQSLHLFSPFNWANMSKSNIPTILEFLMKYPEKISWFDLSANESNIAIQILKEHLDKINWIKISANPSAIEIIESNLDKVYWKGLSKNPMAVHILEQHIDNVDFFALSQNPNAIHLISQNLDKICRYELSRNPNAMDFLMKNQHLIDNYALLMNPNSISYWEERIEQFTNLNETTFSLLALNPNSLPLIQKILDMGIEPPKYINYIYCSHFMLTGSGYELDYISMSKQRMKIIKKELIQKTIILNQ